MSKSAVIKAKYSTVYFDEDFSALKKFLNANNFSSVTILTDRNTKKYCLKKFLEQTELKNYSVLTIEAGEKNKSLNSAITLWNQLAEYADRKALIINLGGGVVSDLGGFSASVFKRGISFINVPTTLLSMTDAAIGSKTGVDFNFHKNQLGSFAHPAGIFISTQWLRTVPALEMLSGYGELAKQAILAGKKSWRDFVKNFQETKNINALVKKAVAHKLKITDEDLRDGGRRKQLNFGHTIGHAFESYFLKKNKPIPHGIAVVAGMICELRLSEMVFEMDGLFQYEIVFLKKKFPTLNIPILSVEEILKMIYSDKKIANKKIKPVLLKEIGKPVWNVEVSIEQIAECINFYRR